LSRIVVFGAAGKAGSRIVSEAAARGHDVVAVARHTESLGDLPPGAVAASGDSTSPDAIRNLVPGADAVVVAVNGPGNVLWRDAAQALVETISTLPEPRPRIIHMGSGATLLLPDGTRPLDSPGFPAQFMDVATGQAAALDYYRSSQGVEWTYFSPPPLEFGPGERRGHYRTGLDHPVTDADGRAVLSYEDFAVALVDEIEQGRFLNTRFTAGY
jgi:putative NADH-flavin reductase